MADRPLTKKQANVLEFVAAYSRQNRYPPTLREIGQSVGLSNVNAVRGHVTALEKKGYIVREPEKARSIRIVRLPSPLSRFKRKLHRLARTNEGVFHRVVYGLVLVTGGRRRLFAGWGRRKIDEAIEHEVVEHGWTLLQKTIGPDHILLVVETWPNHSPEQTVRRFRAAGRALKHRHPKRFPGRFWARGYAVTTDLELLEELRDRLLDQHGSG